MANLSVEQHPQHHQPLPTQTTVQTVYVSDIERIIAAFAGVVSAIDRLTLQITEVKTIMALDATKLGHLFDLVNQLLATSPNNAATIADLQNQITTLKANDAALDALSPQLDPLITAVTAAEPPPKTTEGVAWSSTTTYVAGDTVLDTAGNLWTAVTPVVGEAPGTNPANWTETTPAPTPAPAPAAP